MRTFIQQQKQANNADTTFDKSAALGITQRNGNLAPGFGNIAVHPPKLPTIQPKLTVNSPGDKYEQEAEVVSEKIVQMNHYSPLQKNHSHTPVVQRKCASCEEEEQGGLQRKESGSSVPFVSANVSETLKSPGHSIDTDTQSFMESRFGYDFSKVKIHTDSQANQSAMDLGAFAYTYQNDIVFGQGQYRPDTGGGKKLLAHELTHTLQQNNLNAPAIQRQSVQHGGATGAPADWSTQVTNANTPALKAALIQSAVGSSVTIVDRTAQSSADSTPDPAHLEPYTASNPKVNFDENLASRAARRGGRLLSNDAGYTFFHNNTSYVVLGSLAINSGNYYSTIYTLNHEFDHVRQNISGSTLQGNASEVDAWTSSFIREFHKSYSIQENTTTGNCLISNYQQYVPLLGYYVAADVSASDKTRAVQRISAYFTSVIQPHPGHLAVFKFWLRHSIDQTNHALANDLIAALSLPISASIASRDFSRFSCAGIPAATYQSPSTSPPVFPSAAATGGNPGTPHP
ncbi:DUF4157 domain-containing protein [Mucilaginibacter sp. OK098]|uniref:eCIS core domain-containing protein n=1 Tax=Mucilaginibacter sp. OK098 TaxID=1855297 RepID=UPI00091D8FBB|nr:DUF4157 domain-containing protein [Mucilaginibacter sp. OK098]SHN01300.1 protein of unknown function [Mucilaginibacter sp. OK098]